MDIDRKDTIILRVLCPRDVTITRNLRVLRPREDRKGRRRLSSTTARKSTATSGSRAARVMLGRHEPSREVEVACMSMQAQVPSRLSHPMAKDR
ncbi:uncharacterized protein J3R85_006015 [Psidium guajava]|nr:uncharacterized protein J3R85_006015 [Psidium guajava]